MRKLSRTVALMRPEFVPPANWRRNPEETLKLAHRRWREAAQALSTGQPLRTIRLYRLANPYMTNQAWKILLAEAIAHCAELRYGLQHGRREWAGPKSQFRKYSLSRMRGAA